ncbi:hypothetical protein MAR_023567 [Mya arenaria]|uniref:ORC1/DEAH AAA+ ATPase domain-containing protein n=1 Tax=Mya arenaria TaxID=6604 RepID=A0ABY7DNB1_MYAAR|nr:hypothetical protein MAR_023567 [Mya arenaria]
MEIGMSTLEYLKKTLDDEMGPDDVAQMLGLMQSKLGKAYAKMLADSKLPSELLGFLENNKPEDEVLSIAFHVLKTMNYHVEDKNIAEYIASCQSTRTKCHGRPGVSVLGREEDIAHVLALLQDNRGVLIYGPGGFGKTTFANELCARLAYPINVDTFVVEMRQSKSIIDLYKGILESIHNIAFDGDAMELQNEVLFRLKQLKNESFFHLDNMEHLYEAMPNELREVLGRLEEVNHKVKWIATSREMFVVGGATKMKEFELKALNNNAAAKLLTQCCGPVRLNEEIIQCLLKKCSNIPLAIVLMGNTLSNFCDSSDPESEWQLKSSFLEHYVFPSVAQGMYGCLQYAFDRIDPSDQTMVAKLSFLGTVTFDVECVSYILDIPMNGQNGALMLMMSLTTKHIVQRASTKYGQHPSMRTQYISQSECVSTEELSEAIQRFFSYVLSKVEPLKAFQDLDYAKVCNAIQQNRDTFYLVSKVFAEIDTVALTESVNNFFGKAFETSVYSFAERQSLFDRIADSCEQKNNLYSCCFWKLEKINGLMTSKDPDDNHLAAELDHVESFVKTIPDHTAKLQLSAKLFYLRGRALRKRQLPDTQYNKSEVLCNFEKSVDLYTQLSSPDNSYEIELSLNFNAIGNVYFDLKDVDNAYKMHAKAAKTIREYTQNGMHPNLTVYEFNMGTVALQKAEYLLGQNKEISGEAMTYYLEALECFNFSMSLDKNIGKDRVQLYGDKLSYRAKLYERLSKFDDALRDRDEALTLYRFLSENDKSNNIKECFLEALIKKGGTHLKHSKTFKRGNDDFKAAVYAAMQCFREVEEIVRDGGGRKLKEELKMDFIAKYRSTAQLYKSSSPNEIEAFCMRYEANEMSDSDSSTETESSLEEITATSPSPSLHFENMDTDDCVQGLNKRRRSSSGESDFM